MIKKGDTLVEVALAIGIFSMVAIAITAVVTSSTSGAQTALETTLTREEVDAQAEALRFIHSSYTTNRNTTSSNKFDELWKTIVSTAYDPANPSGVSQTQVDALLKFNPGTCSNVYNDEFIKNHAFVVNPRMLSQYINGASGVTEKDVIISMKDKTSKFITAPISPRLVFGATDDDPNLLNLPAGNTLSYAEGIFVVAVRDNKETKIVDSESAKTAKEQAYYDFYIRTCWYGTNANEPSTVSTAIRLYDPNSVEVVSTQDQRIAVRYYDNISNLSLGKEPIRSDIFATASGYKFLTCDEVIGSNCGNFLGWLNSRNGKIYQPGDTISGDSADGRSFRISAVWLNMHYVVYFNNNREMNGVCAYPESGYIPDNGLIQIATGKYIQMSGCTDRNKFEKLGFELNKWTTKTNGTGDEYTPGETKRLNSDLVLYAHYEPFGLFYDANGGNFVNSSTGEIYNLDPTNCPDGCNIASTEPTRSGYEFLGWCRVKTSSETCSDSWGIKQPDDFVTIDKITNLYAVWRPHNETITITLEWNGPSDLDSHVEGFKSNGTKFHAYYGIMVGSDIDGSTIASLNTDNQSSHGAEIFTINTLGGRDYYYYVHAYASDYVYNARVTVSGPYSGTKVYCSGGFTNGSANSKFNEGCDGKYATGTGKYWNVFAYKNGTIVDKQTRSGGADTNY